MSTHKTIRRGWLASAALTLMATSFLAATPVAQAAGPEANLATTVLKITGRTFGAGTTIPSGLSLTKAILTTDDPDSGAPADAFVLSAFEPLVVKVDGVIVGSTLPQARATNLATNGGTFVAQVFSAGGNSYAIVPLNQNLASATLTTAPSRLNQGAITSLFTRDYGFLPRGAQPRAGQVFSQSFGFGTGDFVGSRLAGYLLYDTDNVRGNSDSIGDEQLITNLNGQTTFNYVDAFGFGSSGGVLATVRFSDDTFAVVRAVTRTTSAAYADTTQQFVFDAAALAGTGHSINDVGQVLSTSPTSHSLTWSQLGFAG